MKRGDLVLVPFPFTDLSSTKNRPALVLLYNDEDVTLSFITTQKRWAQEWDLYLEPTDQNGLKKPSIVRLAKITTLEKSLILGRLGTISEGKFDELQQNLRLLFESFIYSPVLQCRTTKTSRVLETLEVWPTEKPITPLLTIQNYLN